MKHLHTIHEEQREGFEELPIAEERRGESDEQQTK